MQVLNNQDLNNWKVGNFKTNGSLENFFKYAFIGVNRANAVIKKVPDAGFSQEQKDLFLGEAYFLRAGITLTWCVTSALFLCINQ